MLSDAATLGEARNWLRLRLDDGATCPVCTQHAKVYRRPMTSTTVRTMFAMHRLGGWLHIPTLLREYLPDVAHQGGYATLAQHWGLITEERVSRPDGGRAGYWKLTTAGAAFVEGRSRVLKYARLYNGRCLSLAGDPVGVREVLGSKFDYAALMGGADA